MAILEGYDFADGLDGDQDMLLNVEMPDTESDCAADLICSELLVDQGSAVEAGPAGDVVVDIKHRGDIRGVHAVHIEGQDADVVGEVFLAVQSYPGDGAQSVAQHPRELHLVFVNDVEASLVRIHSNPA